MFFKSWLDLWRVLVVGVIAYATLILWLRLSDKRTLSKWNSFDFVVTISLGSALATLILSKQVSLSEGVLAMFLLVALQYAITWQTVRSRDFERLIKASPTLLFYDGQFLHSAMMSQRVPESEVRAAIRGKGLGALEDVAAVVLETDGSFSVIPRSQEGGHSALADLPDLPDC